ncbi:MAG: ferritin-like domain-containing protein [Stackebrandtia sp.]
MTGEEGLQTGLEAEHAAIFAYGAAGPFLSEELQKVVAEAENTRRDRRDALVVLLLDSGREAPPAKPAYTLPTEVSDSQSAAELVGDVENAAVEVWRAAVADTSGDDRLAAVEAYAESAVLVARWRRAIGETPATTAFPGRPQEA